MLTSILDTGAGTGTLQLGNVLICTGIALILGVIIALVYMSDGKYTKNFTVSLVILPALIQAIIAMVNGNLGTSVAVLGAFSLVRFRSVPGNSKDISYIVFAMAIGLATGVGFVSFAVLMTVIIGIAFFLLFKTKFGEKQSPEKELKVTIPENIDYTTIFDNLFAKFTNKVSLERVKTTNLGSMYELHYMIALKEENKEKQLIDELRCRNGNLPIVCGRPKVTKEEL